MTGRYFSDKSIELSLFLHLVLLSGVCGIFNTYRASGHCTCLWLAPPWARRGGVSRVEMGSEAPGDGRTGGGPRDVSSGLWLLRHRPWVLPSFTHALGEPGWFPDWTGCWSQRKWLLCIPARLPAGLGWDSGTLHLELSELGHVLCAFGAFLSSGFFTEALF